MTARICVIGAGRWGMNHARTLNELGCLAGVLETDTDKLADVAAAYPDVSLHRLLKNALSADYDGFTIATPAQTHYTIARDILDLGKHVLVEKPMAMAAMEARELAALADRRGSSLMVGHVMLFHPAIEKIISMVRGGEIGRLMYLYSNRLNLGTVRTEENALMSLAPHDVSIFQALTGERPGEVTCRGAAVLQPPLHDSTVTVLRYPSGIVGHIYVSWLHPFKEHRLVVVGSKGMLSFEADGELRLYEKGIDWVGGMPVAREGSTSVLAYDKTPPLARELAYFASNLGKKIDKSGAESAIDVLDILERATADLTGKRASFFAHESAVVDDGCEIGSGTKIWHFSHVQSGARIGNRCTLGQNVNVGPNVRIGNDVKIQNNVSVYDGVELEDFVFCGPSMTFTNVLVPRSKFPTRDYKRTLIREGASLGANCTIVCGTTVGRHAMVAAGAVVTKDVPDNALVAGVPAKIIGWVCECGNRCGESGSCDSCSVRKSA